MTPKVKSRKLLPAETAHVNLAVKVETKRAIEEYAEAHRISQGHALDLLIEVAVKARRRKGEA